MSVHGNIRTFLNKIDQNISQLAEAKQTNKYIVVVASLNSHGEVTSVNISSYKWAFWAKIVAAFNRAWKSYSVTEQNDAIKEVTKFSARNLRHIVLPNVKVGDALTANSDAVLRTAEEILKLEHEDSTTRLVRKVKETVEELRKLQSTIESEANDLKASEHGPAVEVRDKSKKLILFLRKNSTNLENEYFRGKQQEIVVFVANLLAERGKLLQARETGLHIPSSSEYLKSLASSIDSLRDTGDSEINELVRVLDSLKEKMKERIEAFQGVSDLPIEESRRLIANIIRYIEDKSAEARQSTFTRKEAALKRIYASVKDTKPGVAPIESIGDLFSGIVEMARDAASDLLGGYEADSHAAKTNQQMIDHISQFPDAKQSLISALQAVEYDSKIADALRADKKDRAFTLATAPLLQASVTFEERKKRLAMLEPLKAALVDLQADLSPEKLQKVENHAKMEMVEDARKQLQAISHRFQNIDAQLPEDGLILSRIVYATKALLRAV